MYYHVLHREGALVYIIQKIAQFSRRVDECCYLLYTLHVIFKLWKFCKEIDVKKVKW